MVNAQTTTLSFRIEPDLKEALHAAAEKEYRSIANSVALMIRDYCGRNGVPLQESARPIAPSNGRRGKGSQHARVPLHA